MKFGTIGSGMIVQRVGEGMLEAAGVQIEACYSRTEEKGKWIAEQLGAKKVYTDLSAMLADPEIDWIYVASPNSLHYPQTMAALEAGKNVLCEKPFASNLSQAKEMFAKAEEKGLLLYEALTTPLMDNYALLKEQLKRIGRLRLVQASYCQYSSRFDNLREGKVTNAFDPNFSGGSLMDINYYNVSFLVSLFGEPEKVSYAANVMHGIDTSGVALMIYPDFVCECSGAKDTTGDNCVQFQGDNGYATVVGPCNSMTQIKVTVRDLDNPSPFGAWKNEEFPANCPFSQWKEEIRNLAKIVQSGDAAADCAMRKQTTLATMATIDRLRADAGIVFAADAE